MSIGFQPLRGEDFWWQLSRGSVVTSGSLQPSQTLLSLETRAEADWLGGVPLYLVYQTLGGHAIMMIRVLVVGGGLWWLLAPRRRGNDSSRSTLTGPSVWCLVTLAAVTLADDLNGTPRFVDCLAIVGVVAMRYRVAQTSNSTTYHGRIPSWFIGWLLFLVWGNLATGMLTGLVAWLIWNRTSVESENRQSWALFRERGAVALAMFVGGMMNPRGVHAWSDSIAAIIPSWRNPPSVLLGTPWQPLTIDGTNRWMGFLVVFSLVWLVVQTRGFRRWPAGVWCFIWFHFLAWSCAVNVILSLVWMVSDVLSDWRANGRWWIVPTETPGWRRGGGFAGPVGALVVLAITNPFATMGWGIDASLDNRMLRISLESSGRSGTAMADDTRSGGMLAWEILHRETNDRSKDRDSMRLQDVAMRAVIAGRYADHRRVLDDLKEQRLMRYWRTDRSAGGYWITLENRDTQLLVISNRHTELIESLEPSIWKPLSLDSPVIPYAPAGDADYAERMVEILASREIVEFQPWRYEFPISTGSIFDRDRWGLRSMLVDEDSVRHQAEVFRAMGLRYAALRVLFVARSEYPETVAIGSVIARCQYELAVAEKTESGQPSRFRYWAVAESVGDALDPDPDTESIDLAALRSEPVSFRWDDSVAPAASRSGAVDAILRDRVRQYLRGGPAELIVLNDFRLPNHAQDPQLMYAGLCGAIEGGLPKIAGRYLQWFENRSVPPAIGRLVPIRRREWDPSSPNPRNSQP